MKSQVKTFLGALLVGLIFSSCNDENETQPETVNTNPYLELVGTVEHREATAAELSQLSPTTATTKVNCILSSDSGCTDGARSEFERYVRECTTYAKIWPPTGAVDVFYKSMIYYVDSDTDINLDQYQDDLQAHVNQMITSSNPAIFVSANIVFWECNERQQNSCVIQYMVYR